MKDRGASRSLRRTTTLRGRTTTATARTLNLNRRTPAGVADTMTPPSTEAFQRTVLAGICPWCGLGPFKVLALHTTRAHAVDRRELRDLAGLTYNTVICAPEVSEARSQLSRAYYEAGMTLRPEDRASGIRKPRQLSDAAKALNMAKLEAARSPEQSRRAGQVAAERVHERLADEYEAVRITYDAVIAETGQPYGAVTETATRLGWSPQKVLTRLNTLRDLGQHHRDRRGDEEVRRCVVCDVEFVVSRSAGWTKKTCSQSCGAKFNGQRARKPPRAAVCMVCGTQFEYVRRGTGERTLCDNPSCRAEMSRRGVQTRVRNATTKRWATS